MRPLLCTASAVGLLLTVSAWAANNPPPGQGNTSPPTNPSASTTTPASPAPAAPGTGSAANAQPGTNAPPQQPAQAQPATGNANNQARSEPQPQTQQATAKPGSADSSFAQQAAAGGKAEVAMGKLAEQRGAIAAVREFGRWMATDHTQADNRLASIAQQSGMQLPSGPDKQQQATMARVEKLHGATFDRAYIAAALRDHRKTVDLFRKEAQSGQDTTLKQFAQQSLPMLEQHLTEAQELAGKGHQAAAHGPVHLKPGSTTAQLNRQELNQVKRAQ